MTDTPPTEHAGFATLVLSLVSNTAILLGDMPDPATGKSIEPDVEAASHMIDLLAMLEVKTRGNLTADEEQLIQQVLYDLRMRFVDVQGHLGARDQKGRGDEGPQDQKGPDDQPRIIIP